MIESVFTWLRALHGCLPPVQAALGGVLLAAGFVALTLLVRRKARPMALPADAGGTLPGDGVWFRVVMVFAMTLPMLVLYAISTLGPLLVRDLHFKPGLLGYLVMSSFGLASVLSLWAGAFVDRLGPRYALMVLFSTIACAFTLMITVKHFYGLVAAAAICGIAQALANPVTNLLIARQVRPENRAKVIGLKQAGVQFAALFAGLVLPGLAFNYGWRAALGTVVPLALLFLATVPFVTPKAHARADKAGRFSPPNPLLSRLMIIQFCVGLSLSAFVTFLPTFATRQGMPMAQAGSLIAVFGVMGIISRMVLTPMGSRLKDESALLLGLIAVAACAMAVTMEAGTDSHWRLWAGAVGVGLTAVGTNAIAMSMLVRDSSFGPVTAASGLVSVAFFGGFALGPPLYGTLADFSGGPLLGWRAMIGVLSMGCLMALALASARRRKTRPAVPPAQTVMSDRWFRAALVLGATAPMLVLCTTGTLGLLLGLGIRVKSGVLDYWVLSSLSVTGDLLLMAGVAVNRLGSRYALRVLCSGVVLALALAGHSKWIMV